MKNFKGQGIFRQGETWISPVGERWAVVATHAAGHLRGWVTLGMDGIHITRRQNDTMFWRKCVALKKERET